MIKENTKRCLSLFEDSIKKSTIFHIPHAKTLIPIKDNYNKLLLENEINRSTDFYADKIFHVKGIKTLVFPYSRAFCDVERFTDDNECMYKFGRGFYYTKDEFGNDIRNINSKNIVYNKYYIPYHEKLNNIVKQKINTCGFVFIIDCHTFPDKPFEYEKKIKCIPDICIGTDNFHTPYWLIEYIKKTFESYNFNVDINYPYSGTLIPSTYYKKNKNVYGIMIEINRKLYLKENNDIIEGSIKKLNKIINQIFEF